MTGDPLDWLLVLELLGMKFGLENMHRLSAALHHPERRFKTVHIAGAKSIPFTEITDRTLRLKSRDELAALFRQAGIKQGDTIVGYCHIGQQATGMLFAARTLGHKVLLYDGSFEDWSARDGAVETTASR